MRIDEYTTSVDPVQGTASATAAVYLLTPLGAGQSLLACVVEQYSAGVWANGWALSAGDWGKLTRLQSGNRLYIAGDVGVSAAASGIGVVGLDAVELRKLLLP